MKAMKTNHIRLLGSLGLLTLPLTCGSQFAIDWHSINGGGGTSTDGVFAISGTIGQPDAGAMSGAGFSIVGGFWSIEAVQMPGAPLLTIRRTQANTVVISWPSPSP